MGGRKRKPTAIKILEGNPGRRPLNSKEPVPTKGAITCPAWLPPEAKREWKRLAKKLEIMGVLTEIDRVALASYCLAYARWRQAEEYIDTHEITTETPSGYKQQIPHVSISHTYSKLMLRYMTELGLTPASRSKIIAEKMNTESKDEMENLLNE